MPRLIDLKGRTFGRWMVIERASVDANANTQWRCRCTCGREKPLRAQNLLGGRTLMCRPCFLTSGNVNCAAAAADYRRSAAEPPMPAAPAALATD